MTASVNEDIDRLDPVPDELKLSTGTVVAVLPLRTRQFFRLLRILTRGAGPLLMEYRLDGDLTTGEFQQRLLTLIALSIPEAEDEAIDFLKAMTKPVGLIEPGGARGALSKQDRERNDVLWADLNEALHNPELLDLLDLVENIVRRESADMQGLAKRLAGMMKLASKTGQLDVPATATPTTPTPGDDPAHRDPAPPSASKPTVIPMDSLVDSPEPSTS